MSHPSAALVAMPESPKGIGGLASTRRGILLRPDLLAAGMRDDAIRALVSSSLVQRMQQGALLASPLQPTWEDRMAAAALATPGALVSHTSAARLHGLDGVKTSMLEITIPYGLGGDPRDGVKVHRTRRLMVGDQIGGIPVVTVEQTLLDIAGVRAIPGSDLLKAVASAIRKRQTTIAALEAFVTTCGRGVGGTRRLRTAIARYQDGSPVPGSDGEVAMFEYFAACGIELPKRQFEITLPSGLHIYLDFAWDLRMKTIELDGLESRASPTAHDQELERQNLIWELGWELRRFSPIALRRRPKETYRQIVRFLES